MSLGLLAYPVRIVNDYQRDDLAARIRGLETNKNKPILVTITDADEKRSNAINRLAHMWYSDCSKQGGEYTSEQVKSLAKLKWGVPIMRKHRKFNDTWMKLVHAFPSYEEKVDLMEYLPLTSLMTNPEMSEFMNHFQAVMGSRYQLTDPKLQGIEL
jgi:hypothetical protein